MRTMLKPTGFLIFVIIVAIIVSFTACGDNTATATTSNTETTVEAYIINESLDPDDDTLLAEPEEVTEDETSEDETSEDEEPDTTEVTAPAITSPIGDPANPAPVDPAPFWHGDDYFDIISYFKACGASEVDWRYSSELETPTQRHGVYCLIDNRELRAYGIDLYNVVDFICVTILHDDRVDDQIDSILLSPEYPPDPTPIWVDEERTICMTISTIQNIWLMMDSFINADCPFANTGIKHIQHSGDYIGHHDDE